MSIKRFVSALLAGTLCLSLLAACGSSQKPAASGVSADAQRYSTIFYDAFDTVTQVIAYCDSEEEFNRQMDAPHTDLLEYHRLYDIYNDYDGEVNVKTINANAGVTIASQSASFRHLFSENIRFLDIEDVHHTRDIVMVHRKGRYLNRASRQFADFLKQKFSP